jgi:hypothetical protein
LGEQVRELTILSEGAAGGAPVQPARRAPIGASRTRPATPSRHLRLRGAFPSRILVPGEKQ